MYYNFKFNGKRNGSFFSIMLLNPFTVLSNNDNVMWYVKHN